MRAEHIHAPQPVAPNLGPIPKTRTLDSDCEHSIFVGASMHKNTIPSWTAEGILPPIAEGALGHGMNRSPYSTDILSLCEHFRTSPKRARILNGFLAYRAKLHSLGLTTGFQWIFTN